jgi:predicted acetyltransferase
MDIEVVKAAIEDKPVLRNLMELYAYDFSEFDGADVDAHGLYGYPYLDNYWTEEGRHPFLIRVDGQLAGLALVRGITEEGKPLWSMAEFFILKKYRKAGAGRTAAWQIFNAFPGAWQVDVLEENLPAQFFWRRVISEYTGGEYVETNRHDDSWQGPQFSFTGALIP